MEARDFETEQEREWAALMESCPDCGKSGFDCECPPHCPKCDSRNVEGGVFSDFGGEKISWSRCADCGYEEYENDGQHRYI
jgi:predicted Zn-ribbon and HTH transcriptional regulator